MDEVKIKPFHEMEIDDRILKAIARLGWLEPTLIQEKAIPLILDGKDVLLRARTGSGKTAAFGIPVIQKILTVKPISANQIIRALVLAPTKELCNQTYQHFMDLMVKCSREIKCVDISQYSDLLAQKPLLIEGPDIVIGTPAKALAHLKLKNMVLENSLEILVIDEADLMFSFGYEKDMKQILRWNYLFYSFEISHRKFKLYCNKEKFMFQKKLSPKAYQAVLASATLTKDVLSLKQLALHNPVTLKLQEPELAPTSQLSHYHLAAEEEEKAVILYVLLKLRLIHGKTIIFVNHVDKCYRIKLYLEQFNIPTCVLNSELPAAMRCHSVNQFNQGIYDLIIASDENAIEDPAFPDPNKRRNRDKESGVIRGIDFQFVSNIINFDFPKTITSYIHRAGRTARGNNEGTALSFVSSKEYHLLEEVENHLKQSFDQESGSSVIKAYEFKMSEVEGFRYRSRDAWRAVTKIAIREARLKEIRQELLNNNKLKSYFQDNPRDLQCLRHDKALHTVKLQPHLANVPEYIIPNSLKSLNIAAALRKKKPKKIISKSKQKFMAKQEDPLISLKVSGFKKKKNKFII